MRAQENSFMDDLRAGVTTVDQIDDYIDRWHDNPNPSGPPLHTFLGLTWGEYKRWAEHGRLPGFRDNLKACGAPGGSRWGYLSCGCAHDGYGGHLR